MNVVVIGSGYVGLVTGCCLAEAGNRVICVDHDAEKIAMLMAGRVPFHEPGLEAILQAQWAAGRLSFDTRIARAMQDVDVAFLAVGTPARADGGADLGNLMRCAHELANTVFDDCIVVVKSTVPVGTGDRIEALLNEKRDVSSSYLKVRVASNPEFLAEGRAVHDFRHPDRIVIGANDPGAALVLAQLYAPFDDHGQRIMLMDRRTAEFSKYACNAMLAARISMINELAGLAGSFGANIQAICSVLKGDPRIGGSYLYPGAGYGGSCLPKDVRALIHAARGVGEPADMLRSAQRVNRRQGRRLLNAVREHVGGRLKGKHIAIWGLSFKPGTDDVRAAPSLTLIRHLLEEGAIISAYDPVAMRPAQRALGMAPVVFGSSPLDVCRDAEALIVMTEWDEFKAPDFAALSRCMRGAMVFDARAIYHTGTLQQYGLQHYHVGSWTRQEAPAKYAYVRARPSSSDTVGCQLR
ncbi:UDP-glucose/GDP-mannose dehydrogenase family protein [Pusillimonas sp. SM2304]|uniref:UDP-glucose dehydrogenase family protein n=1 Tax=Pusillimonas sp. SM2304 TaxID=3073241 RepID=UPI002874446C|nr:UDP-glucose/GDP-mannose dehydrogenase family protein [Pusillimonas sp. SM2304]MDS1139727.1 UDP-glucose/GDP-mannose dehydrogenase family protein [Pusillimonas sp. SM2304]